MLKKLPQPQPSLVRFGLRKRFRLLWSERIGQRQRQRLLVQTPLVPGARQLVCGGRLRRVFGAAGPTVLPAAVELWVRRWSYALSVPWRRR